MSRLGDDRQKRQEAPHHSRESDLASIGAFVVILSFGLRARALLPLENRAGMWGVLVQLALLSLPHYQGSLCAFSGLRKIEDVVA